MGTGARKKPARKKKAKPHEPKERLRPVSLYPLDFDSAIRAIVVFNEPTESKRKGSSITDRSSPQNETEG
jgi:hypothetical protein